MKTNADLNKNNYIPYHVHTEYSLLDSCDKPETYVNLARENGMRALSFSEHGKPLNWTEKLNLCNKAGIKYIHSVEIYLTETLSPKVRDNYHTILIAKNMDGVRELNEIVSRSTDPSHFYYVNRISFEEFLNLSDNIITTSACLASPLNKLPESHPMYEVLAKKYTFYEVQGHNNPEQKKFNKHLLELSRKYNKLLIAGTDTHSSSKYMAECRDAFLDAKHKRYEDEGFDLTFKTYDELVEMFRVQGVLNENEYMQAINNTNLLYDMTDEIILDTKIKYPILYGSREEDSKKFKQVVAECFEYKIKKGIIPREQEQAFRDEIAEEMRVFDKLEMNGFMLSMHEIVGWCRSQGMAIGTARGSVGGSSVAYVTDITDLNAQQWHTVFSRFANENRKEIGDIDIDCIEEDRPKIFEYIINRFGTEKTARVASFGTNQAKGVIDDVGRHLANEWRRKNPNGADKDNPWNLENIAKIKKEFDENEERTKKKYSELFYYFDGLYNKIKSQSIHPAGIVISPITLSDNFGTFYKDGEQCLMLDMDNVHDFTGLAKYDFLILKTLQVVRDCYKSIGKPLPKSHEVNWSDSKVWENMTQGSTGLFQFESNFAFECLKKFKPTSLNDLAILTATLRPSGASYRDEILKRKIKKNPSKIIDDMLEDTYGQLIFQEQIIKFLQEICGLSGGDADNVRRAISRKKTKILDEALPKILEGYCTKSDKSRKEAEREAKDFLQVIEDSSNYMFGRNHAIAYCMMTYCCAYLRTYYTIEFITAYLNNAANEEDIKNGTIFAERMGIKITMPKWGISKDSYAYDKKRNIIAKGLASIKFLNVQVSKELYDVALKYKPTRFMEVLKLLQGTSINSRQLDILIKIDFFSNFGNQRELLLMADIFYNMLNKGNLVKVSKAKIENSPIEPIIKKYSTSVTRLGNEAKLYTVLDNDSILIEVEDAIKGSNLYDLSAPIKAKNFYKTMGYAGYISGKEEDRRKLYITKITPLVRKRDNKKFGYSLFTKSIGSGIESRFTVVDELYKIKPVEIGDIVYCKSFVRNGIYFRMTDYEKI